MSFHDMRCRFCQEPLRHTFVDLGVSPLANAFIKPEREHGMEPCFPLHAYVCDRCFLVQLEEYESPKNIFEDYVYFSSFSESWLEHCARYADRMIDELGLDKTSSVVEIASNDGYLLQFFKKRKVPVLGVEPAKNVALAAIEKGIPTETAFFGMDKAKEMRSRGISADLMVANNVLAHVPDVNDFIEGFDILLKPDGVATFEFPHLLELMEEVQFDTIYHEHFSYLSLSVAKEIFAAHGLEVFHVEKLPTHGGSLRLYIQHAGGSRPMMNSIADVVEQEKKFGLMSLETYQNFSEKVKSLKRDLLSLLIAMKNDKKTIVAYGAAAKGNTLLNYCGIRTDFIDYAVDRSPHKQGLYLPGSRIPVYDTEKIRETRPDYILILPWNLKEEITGQMSFVRDWGGRFIVPVPEPRILE